MQNRKIVCIDSDGCAMDTMDYKHKHCFGPIAAEVWKVEEKEKFFKLWNKINLYSKTRGVNRFKGLCLVFEKMNMRLTEVEKWLSNTKELSNNSLKKELEKNKNKELERALTWSECVNSRIETLKDEVKPFFNVAKVIKKIKKYCDIAIVSSANRKAIEYEWTKFDLLKYVDIVMGQEKGTKQRCLSSLIKQGYKAKNIIMLGDSPCDIEVAKNNDCKFYPIIVGQEEESWKIFGEKILYIFLNDKYDDKEYIKRYERIIEELDNKN